MAFTPKVWHNNDPSTAWSAAAAIDLETRLSAYTDTTATATVTTHNALATGIHGIPSMSSGQGILWNGSTWVATTLAPTASPTFTGTVTVSSGIIRSIVTALPGSPVDGQEILYQTAAMATAGQGPWLCRYRSASGFTNKWDVIGASPISAKYTSSANNNTTSFTSTSMFATAPANGDYLVSFGALVSIGGTAPYDSAFLAIQISSPSHPADETEGVSTGQINQGINFGIYISRDIGIPLAMATSATATIYHRALTGGVNTVATTRGFVTLVPLRLG